MSGSGFRLGTWSRRSLHRYAAPATLRRRVEANFAERPVDVHPLPWERTAACVVLAVAAMVGLRSLQPASSADLMSRDVTSSHVRSLMGGHLRDIASTNSEAVAAWFSGKLDYAPRVRDFAAQGYALLGGRLDYVGNRSVAAIVYVHRNHYINLFSCPLDARAPVERSTNRLGFNAIGWSDADRQYWAVADVDMQELARFAALVRG